MASENETVEKIVKRVRRDCNSYPIPTAAVEMLKLVREFEAAHRREVAELRECLNRRSKYINTILQKALELDKSVPLELREVMDDCIVAEDKAIGLGVFSKK